MKRSLAIVVLSLSAPAGAQTAYDAGTPGNPAIAPSPVTQGWSESNTSGGTVHPVSPDPDFPYNAWQVNDGGAGEICYRQGHPWLGQEMYEFGFVMRVLAGRLYLRLVAGPLINDNIFALNFDVVGSDVHLVRQNLAPLVFPGAVDGYHSYRFVSGYTWDYAYVFFDDAYVGTKSYDGFGSAGNAFIEFGTTPALAGRARFHRVWFDFLQDHELGAAYCEPAEANSTGLPGRISAYGLPFVWQNSVELRAADLPPGQFGYFLASRDQDHVPVGQGFLCLGGSIGRFNQPGQIQSIPAGGAISLALDLTQIPTPNGPVAMIGGETWNFQCWYRDMNPGPTSNLTDGLMLTLP